MAQGSSYYNLKSNAELFRVFAADADEYFDKLDQLADKILSVMPIQLDEFIQRPIRKRIISTSGDLILSENDAEFPEDHLGKIIRGKGSDHLVFKFDPVAELRFCSFEKELKILSEQSNMVAATFCFRAKNHLDKFTFSAFPPNDLGVIFSFSPPFDSITLDELLENSSFSSLVSSMILDGLE